MLRSYFGKLTRSAIASAMLFMVLFSLIQPALAVVSDPCSYAAVAYSPSTGHYGYVYNYYSRSEAERAALSEVSDKDARIVGWVNDGWLVLAIGDNKAHGVGWEFGDGALNTTAARRAIAECEKQNGNVRKLIVLNSANYEPKIIESTSKIVVTN